MDIALKHAIVSKEDTRIARVKLDDYRYRLDFISGDYKHEYEIRGDGVILKLKRKLAR